MMRKFLTTRGILLGLMLFTGAQCLFPGCKNNDGNDPDPVPNEDSIGVATALITRGDKQQLLGKIPEVEIKSKLTNSFPVIEVDTTSVFQEIEGFGAALTGSSAYLINKVMNESQRAAVLTDLFDPVEGIGISYLRLTMGASDFSLSDFTYDDMPAGQTDFGLDQFSLSRDLEDVVPVLLQILQINPGIKLMGSPWSPPAWMKTNGSLVGGKLRTDCYDVYADYFVKYIQAMQSQGINIDAVTPQNEPLHFTASYPCMEMQPEEQRDFIRDHLGPKFAAAGISTKIITYDHNWDRPDYGITILDDILARTFVAGTAFHAYAGNVTAMSAVHAAHPDKGLYFTEISGGAWATDFSSNLMWYMENILIGTVNNWSKNALFWNLALNQFYGPQNQGCSNCRGVITINDGNGSVTKNEEYYALAHFTKAVKPGAVKVSTTIPSTLPSIIGVAFLNPDGSKSLVICNEGNENKVFTVRQAGKYFTYTLQANSVVTFFW